MSTKEYNNIDLKREIIDKSSIVIREDNSAVYYALNYFLSENLNALIGKSVFDKNSESESVSEIDVTRISQGLIINTIFGKHYRINFIQNRIECYEINLGEEKTSENQVGKVFSINIGPNVMTNILTHNQDNDKIEYKYEINVDDKSFSYAYGKEKDEPKFSAKLIYMNSKIKAKEVFEYIREKPPIEQEVSFTQRVKDYIKGDGTLRGEGIINIYTSEELGEIFEYTDRIFNRLKEEDKKLNNINSPKKELKN